MSETTKRLPIVIIYNFLEDIIDTFRTLSEEDKSQIQLKQNQWDNQNEILGGISEFSNRQVFFVFSQQADEGFISYACHLLEVERRLIQILVPRKKSKKCLGSMCEYIIQDQDLITRLKQIPKFDLISYCISEEFLQLTKILKNNANVINQVSEESWSKVKRFTTKPGIRQLVQNLNNPNIFMPPGKIFYHSATYYEEAISFIAKKVVNEGIVIKTQKFYAGRGVIIIKPDQVQNFNETQRKLFIQQKMKEPYWKIFDIVVEDFIDVNPHIGPPCVQINIQSDGKVQVVWMNAMIMEGQKDYVGIQACQHLFTNQIENKLIYISKTLGRIYFNMGYRGYINIDFLLDKKNKLYLGQSNVRRSASLFIHNFAVKMHGADYKKDRYIMTHTLTLQKLVGVKLSDFIQKLQKLQINYTKEKGYGVVISCQNSFKSGFLDVFTITKTRQEGFVIEDMLKQIYM